VNDKEKLEEIKARRDLLHRNGYALSFPDEVIDCLIHKVEQLEVIMGENENHFRNIKSMERMIKKLEKENKQLKVMYHNNTDAGIDLKQENKRFRECLGRLQRATNRYPAEDMAYVVNKITSEALEKSE